MNLKGSIWGLILRQYLGICLEGQRKTVKNRITGLRAKILTRDLLNTKQKWPDVSNKRFKLKGEALS
jgi:hypothetical protein